MIDICDILACCECLLYLTDDLTIFVTERQKPTPSRQERLAKAKARRRNRQIRRFLRRRKRKPDLPIPRINLVCRQCAYRLEGLTGDRCPECGKSIDLRRYIDRKADYHRTRRRKQRNKTGAQ